MGQITEEGFADRNYFFLEFRQGKSSRVTNSEYRKTKPFSIPTMESLYLLKHFFKKSGRKVIDAKREGVG